MRNNDRKKKIKLWNEYFRQKLKIGLSWHDIRKHLIIRNRYPSKLIELLIYNYNLETEKELRKRVTAAVLACILVLAIIVPIAILKPTITGRVIGGGNIYYVNISHLYCNDSYDINTAQNINTPWCSLGKGLLNLKSGDTLYLATGVYNNNNSYVYQNRLLTDKTTIAAYPDNHPVITNFIQSYYVPLTNTWVKQSSGSLILWTSMYVTSSVTLSILIASSNVTPLVYSSFNDFINTSLPRGFFFNTTTDTLYLKWNDSSFNPN